MIDHQQQERLYTAACHIAVAKLALSGLRHKESTGDKISELEFVGVQVLLDTSIRLIEGSLD